MTDAVPHALPAGPVRVSTPFGEFDVEPRDAVAFPDGLPGFEQCRRFVVLSSRETAPVQYLHGIEGPSASFLAIDPRLVLPGYRCTLSEQDRRRLQLTPDTVLLWLALITLDEGQVPSVNLRAPVVINPARMIGFQVVPHDSLYPLRHPLRIG